MILLPDAKRIINDSKTSAIVKTTLLDVLALNLILMPPKLHKDIVLFIENLLVKLGYLAADQANGIWGDSTTKAFTAACLPHYVKFTLEKGIGQTSLLAILSSAPPVNKGVDLDVPYYSQRDSETSHAWRMCFASSCAMLLKYIKPDAISGPNADDAYLRRLFTLSPNADTVNAQDQIRTLLSYGVQATMHYDLTPEKIDHQLLVNKKPVPVGYLHQGPLAKLVRVGGHWSLIKGISPDGKYYIFMDPFGELDVINGVYVSANGKNVHYSKKNWLPRWMVDGSGGWGIIA